MSRTRTQEANPAPMGQEAQPANAQPATIEIDAYRPHPRNYNRHPAKQIERIAASLRKFGQVRSVVVWRSYYVAGHGVAEAARSIGWTELHANVLPDDYPEHLALAYVVADNELARMGDPDMAQLAAILEESRAVDEELLAAMGFDDAGLADVIRAIEADENGQDRHTDERHDEERARALVEKWQTKPGQIWLCGRSRLMCGDSTDPAAIERLLAGRTADLMIADPPYNVAMSYASADVDDDRSAEEYEQFTRAWFDPWRARTIRAVITPGLINFSLWSRLYWKQIKQVAPWTKTNSMTRGYISRFACWEPMLFFGDADPAWEPVLFVNGDAPPKGEKWKRIRNNDVFSYPVGSSDPINLHPCPKPPAWVADLINSYSDIDDLIVDPFNGSGTTLVKAEQMIRTAAVMEINPIWVASTLERYQMQLQITPTLLTQEG